jgi:hypothetical protein
MSNLTDVQSVIDAHEANAQTAFNELQRILGQLAGIGAVIPGSLDSPNVVTDPKSTVSYLSPDLDLYNAFQSEFAQLFPQLSAWLTGVQSSFIDLFFPEISDVLAPEADAWLIGVIRDGDTGIPESVQEAIFERGRERIVKDAARARAAALSEWAAMGFQMPAPVLSDRVARIDQDTSAKVAELNRDLTIKVTDVQLDMVKFAIQQTTELRTAVVGAVNDYLRSFASLPGTAAEIVNRHVDTKKTLWDASSRYYAALLDYKRIEAEINIAKSRTSAEQAKIDVDALQANLTRQLSATEAAAETYGQLVSAAMSGLNSVVTNAYQANAQE